MFKTQHFSMEVASCENSDAFDMEISKYYYFKNHKFTIQVNS